MISDAESLALERSQSLAGSSQESSTTKQFGLPPQTNVDSVKERNGNHCSKGDTAVKQPSFENDDSGYYGKSDVKETTFNTAPNTCKKDQFVNNNVGIIQIPLTYEVKQAPRYTRLGSLSHEFGPNQVRVDNHQPAKNAWDSRSGASSSANLVKLPLAQVVKENSESCAKENIPVRKDASEVSHHSTEEKAFVTKDVKEVCNSSIKGGHDSSDVPHATQKLHFSESASSQSHK